MFIVTDLVRNKLWNLDLIVKWGDQWIGASKFRVRVWLIVFLCMESCCIGDLCPTDGSFYTIPPYMLRDNCWSIWADGAESKWLHVQVKKQTLARSLRPPIDWICFQETGFLTKSSKSMQINSSLVSTPFCYCRRVDPGWVLTNQRWPVGGNVCFHPNECAVVSANTLISTETHRPCRGLPTMRFGYIIAFSAVGVAKSCAIPSGLDSVFHLYEPPSGVAKSLNQ